MTSSNNLNNKHFMNQGINNPIISNSYPVGMLSSL